MENIEVYDKLNYRDGIKGFHDLVPRPRKRRPHEICPRYAVVHHEDILQNFDPLTLLRTTIGDKKPLEIFNFLYCNSTAIWDDLQDIMNGDLPEGKDPPLYGLRKASIG